MWDADEQRTPFEALLEASGRDPEAAAGLALAYADMPRAAREKLVAEVGGDANALALLLGVEREPDIARAIAAALHACPRGPADGEDLAFAWGDERAGGAAVVRHLYGEFVDALRVSWTPGAMDALALPIGRADDLEALRTRAAIPEHARSIPREHAVDAIAEALWRRHRAGHPMPREVAPFAELFGARPR